MGFGFRWEVPLCLKTEQQLLRFMPKAIRVSPEGVRNGFNMCNSSPFQKNQRGICNLPLAHDKSHPLDSRLKRLGMTNLLQEAQL